MRSIKMSQLQSPRVSGQTHLKSRITRGIKCHIIFGVAFVFLSRCTHVTAGASGFTAKTMHRVLLLGPSVCARVCVCIRTTAHSNRVASVWQLLYCCLFLNYNAHWWCWCTAHALVWHVCHTATCSAQVCNALKTSTAWKRRSVIGGNTICAESAFVINWYEIPRSATRYDGPPASGSEACWLLCNLYKPNHCKHIRQSASCVSIIRRQ